MTSKRDIGLVLHELMHVFSAVAVGVNEQGSELAVVSFLGEEAATQIFSDDPFFIASGAVAHVLYMSDRVENVGMSMLMAPQIALFLMEQFAPEDKKDLTKLKEADLDKAIRQAVLFYYLIEADNLLSRTAEILAERIGDDAGFVLIETQPLTELLCELKHGVDDLMLKPQYFRHPTTVQALIHHASSPRINANENLSFARFCRFQPVPPERLLEAKLNAIQLRPD